jgi:long-subunit fatty acid transport protein
LDWFEKDLISDFARAGRTLQTSKDDGSGYLAGPLMSYQTDGGKWSVSFAPMFLSSFSQDWGGSLAGMEMNADLDLERIDYDLAVSYALNKDFWIYFGHKYQEIEIDFVLSYETMMGSITNKYKLESEVHMPTAGAGYVYLVSDKIALSAQLGLLYSVPDLKMTDNDGTVYDIWPRATFGFNSEVTMNYQPLNKVIIQAGYRYQYFRLDARQPDTWNKTESDDITHGLTLSGVWIF